MPEPYSDEHQTIAEEITAQCLERLVAAGLDPLEAAHGMVHAGLDALPGAVCRHRLAGELEAVIEAAEDRIEEIPSLTPGVDVVACRADTH
jgi:hypothetical protein